MYLLLRSLDTQGNSTSWSLTMLPADFGERNKCNTLHDRLSEEWERTLFSPVVNAGNAGKAGALCALYLHAWTYTCVTYKLMGATVHHFLTPVWGIHDSYLNALCPVMTVSDNVWIFITNCNHVYPIMINHWVVCGLHAKALRPPRIPALCIVEHEI